MGCLLVAATVLVLVAGSGAGAQEAPETAEAATEKVVVFGAGEARQTQFLSKEDVRQAPAGVSPIKLLNKFAGVNFQAADPFGVYEWGVRISVRGFNQGQMGFTLDDVPLGDMFYSSLNGLYISRALINENLARAQISQGTGSLDTASTSNLGGTIKFLSVNPGDQLTTGAAQTFGSDATRRTFVKFESGAMPTDTRFYIAVASQSQELWKGDGEQSAEQVNLKLVQPLANGRFSAFLNYADRQEMDYQDLTKTWIRTLGYRWSNYWPDLAAAIANASSTSACCGVPVRGNGAVNDPLNAAYYSASGVRRDALGYASLDIALDDSLSWKTSVYRHSNRGVSTWSTPYRATPGPNGTPLSERVLANQFNRVGVLSVLIWDRGPHTISSGIWYEHNAATQKRLFFPIYLDGPLWSPYEIPDENTAFLKQWAYQFTTNTLQWHLQDTWHLTDDLTLHGGFKSLQSKTSGTPTVNRLGKPLAHGTISIAEGFLPQFGAVFKLGPHDELFADVSNTARNFQQGGYGLGISPWAVGNQSAFNLIQGKIRPESAWTLESGYRFRRTLESAWFSGIEGSLAAYYVDFNNRLLNISPGGSLIETTAGAALLANVGGVTTYGVEVGSTVRLVDRWSWYNAFSYNHSTYDSDYVDGDKTIAIAGKTVVDAPRILYKSEIAYQAPRYFMKLNADYMSRRYVTYSNDVSAGPRWILNFTVGTDLGKFGPLAGVNLSMNIVNLFNEKYISTIGTGGFSASGDNQTLQVGSPRQVFLTLQATI